MTALESLCKRTWLKRKKKKKKEMQGNKTRSQWIYMHVGRDHGRAILEKPRHKIRREGGQSYQTYEEFCLINHANKCIRGL